MKVRPTIFLSGVSQEFGSFRDAIENEIEMKGCFAENQPGFPPDPRTIEENLTRKIHDSDAVIHIVGFRLGFEPKDREPGRPRRSYTQMELDIARRFEKPVYLFFSKDATVRDSPKPGEQPEDDATQALQIAHREAIRATNYHRYTFGSREELCKLVAEIPIVAQAEFRADISRILKYAPAELIGRETELKLLDDAWLKVRRAESPRPRVLTFVALGGEGKTSLVAKWVAKLADENWPGCDAVFAWSFYSQGTREQVAASSDLFLKEALTFFGDDADRAFAASPAGAFEKGQRLARVVGQRRCLLILDGLEPLQYAPTSPTPGQLKDQGIAALLKGLAAASHGLCVVTTRYSLPDLRAFWQTTAPEMKLLRLSRAAGVHLLKTLGVRGTAQEFEALVEDVKGHALTLQIMGGYLRRAFGGDIRQRDRVKFEKADEKIDGGHAFRAMAAYGQWMADGSDEARRELAILRSLGLFDRPATRDCLAVLLQPPAIAGLTEPLAGAAEDDWQFSLDALARANLLAVNRDSSGTLLTLDTHPHIREYFAKQLREKNPDAWRAAHRRLYEHLQRHDEGNQPKLEDLQPLYQAVAHGCRGALFDKALRIYTRRINREHEFYSTKKLGAFGSDLGAIACFFSDPWTHLFDGISKREQVVLRREAGVHLRALGRLAEAKESQRRAIESVFESNPQLSGEDWKNCAISATNLSELCRTLGDLDEAAKEGARNVAFSDRVPEPIAKHGDSALRIASRTALGDALHQAGRTAEAIAVFKKAEEIQERLTPEFPLLFTLRGFHYCDMLLTGPEQAAWKRILGLPQQIHPLGEISHRAARTLSYAENRGLSVFAHALDRLTLGRAAVARAILSEQAGQGDVGVMRLSPVVLQDAHAYISAAISGLRSSGRQDFLPFGLLAHAYLRFLEGKLTGHDGAQEDLDEAWEIAERGPMRLHLADIHLHRARLFFREPNYPWGTNSDGAPRTPDDDLAAAEKLINQCGYHRRDEELADAKAALKLFRTGGAT